MLFFQSNWRYHLDTCRPEFYYKCDWNGAKIIEIVQQTKKMSGENIMNIQPVLPIACSLFNEDLGHLEDVVLIKTADNKRYTYVCIRSYLLLLAGFSAHHFQLKCMGGDFFLCHPYIGSATCTILSDTATYTLYI